jgi:hypothetical protein
MSENSISLICKDNPNIGALWDCIQDQFKDQEDLSGRSSLLSLVSFIIIWKVRKVKKDLELLSILRSIREKPEFCF